MVDYAWTISVDKQSALGVTGISSSYIIPRAEMKSFDHLLAGKKLWVTLRGQQDRCIAAITVKRMERFLEGLNAGDFLIYTDTTKSIRFCSNYEEATPYAIPLQEEKSFGISQLNDHIVEIIKS